MKKDQTIPDNRKEEPLPPSEDIIMDLPEVKDIPGQEHIHVPPAGELADTTASSADEEGEGLLDDVNEEEDDLDLEGEDNVSDTERQLLDDAATIDPLDEEEQNLRNALPDDTDDDGDPLNEDELDVPGAEDDDEEQEMGAEDEENNEFSVDKNSD